MKILETVIVWRIIELISVVTSEFSYFKNFFPPTESQSFISAFALNNLSILIT